MKPIILNFMPLIESPPAVTLFHKEVSREQHKDPKAYRTFEPSGRAYDLSVLPKDGFSTKLFELGVSNCFLTLHYISQALASQVQAAFGADVAARSRPLDLYNDICITIETLRFGRRIMRIRPKYLEAKSQFGLLVKEEYWKNPGATFGKNTLLEDGSLDAKGNPNVGYHQEAWRRLITFVSDSRTQKLVGDLVPAFNPSVTFRFSSDFRTIQASIFAHREFQVGGGTYCRNALSGIAKNGPFREIGKPIRLLFIAREEERVLARTLYTGLINGNDKTKPQNLLRFKMDIHPAKFLPIQAFDEAGITLLDNRLNEFSKNDLADTIAVCVLPDTSSDGYHRLKACLMKRGLHSQCCTRSLVASAYSFKWALANIALGIFSKGGGVPWRVKPHKSKSIIIGVGQSLESGAIEGDSKARKLIRHRTFSVLTDSTGEFHKIDSLATGDSDEGANYIDEFSNRIGMVLSEGVARSGDSELVVIHTPFSLRKRLTEALERIVADLSISTLKTFVVIKFNSASDMWFGFSQENNKIPLEGSFCHLSERDFLIWFEGADRFTKQAKRRCGPPASLKIIGKLPSSLVIQHLLQDAYDLAGANWRGFNARGLPVSMYYCKLIADFLRGFHEAGLDAPELEDLNPWFL